MFICSVGFCSDTNMTKSKDEVEEMLVQEIRNACKQQELFHSCGSPPAHDECMKTAPDCMLQSLALRPQSQPEPQAELSPTKQDLPQVSLPTAALVDGHVIP